MKIRIESVMQINMKPTPEERSDLLDRMRQARRRLGFSYADISVRASVDPSQVSRICRGEFVTFSDSVVRICIVLDVPLRKDGSVSKPEQAAEVAGGTGWAKLERSVRKAWDNTPIGAERLANVLAAVADLSKP